MSNLPDAEGKADRPLRLVLAEALLTSLPEQVRGDENFTWLSSRDELLANEEGLRRRRTGDPDAYWERWAEQLDSWVRWGKERGTLAGVDLGPPRADSPGGC